MICSINVTTSEDGDERVNIICPCVVETDMLCETKQTVAIPHIPLSPEEMADVAVFLASNKGWAITGTTINAFG